MAQTFEQYLEQVKRLSKKVNIEKLKKAYEDKYKKIPNYKIYEKYGKKADKEYLYELVSKTYKKNTEDYDKKLRKFDKIFDTAERISVQARPNNLTGISSLIENLVLEYYQYKDSIVDKFDRVYVKNAKGERLKPSFKTTYERARKLATISRLKNFKEKYGNETILIQIPNLYEGKEKEIRLGTLINKYKNGEITKNDLFKYIRIFKDKELSNYNTVEYRSQSKMDIEDYFSNNNLES